MDKTQEPQKQQSRGTGRPKLSRRSVLSAVLERMERSELEVPDLAALHACAMVSPRTLQTMFQDAFGIAPSRYLRLRRLHQLHISLLMAEPSLRTVSELCSHLGFTDMGRVARDYALIFSEYPSQTLARRPNQVTGTCKPRRYER